MFLGCVHIHGRTSKRQQDDMFPQDIRRLSAPMYPYRRFSMAQENKSHQEGVSASITATCKETKLPDLGNHSRSFNPTVPATGHSVPAAGLGLHCHSSRSGFFLRVPVTAVRRPTQHIRASYIRLTLYLGNRKNSSNRDLLLQFVGSRIAQEFNCKSLCIVRTVLLIARDWSCPRADAAKQQSWAFCLQRS